LNDGNEIIKLFNVASILFSGLI